MSYLRILILVGISFSIPVLKLQAQEQEGKVIEELLHAYYESMSQRDWESYRTFFIDSALLVTVWEPGGTENKILHRSTIEEFIRKTPEGPDSQPIFEERMRSSQIEVHGGMATAWVDYKARFGTEENLMEWNGKDLFTLIRWENTWKIVSLTYLSE